MPSTYSPNLRIELIATGEQANTWGATTNTNLGTLLEQAISGIAEVNVTAGNVTLTAANGASDEARCMVLKVTGLPGVSRNVITPASVTKAYIVHNTSDAAVVIKTAAAGTNATVTVQAGGKQGVYTDGTNVYDITSATSTEISYLTGVTSNIQTQINGKQGAITVNGIVKSNGSGTFSAAVAGTDYVAPSGSITGNAGTVTNGVYTTGDQTIGGTKTFSSTIQGNISGNAATATNATNATTATKLGTTSGSAPVYGARAYGSFNTAATYTGGNSVYTGTWTSTFFGNNVSMASAGTATTTVTFATAMANTNYAVVILSNSYNATVTNKTASSFTIGLSTVGNPGFVTIDFVVFG